MTLTCATTGKLGALGVAEPSASPLHSVLEEELYLEPHIPQYLSPHPQVVGDSGMLECKFIDVSGIPPALAFNFS